MDEQKQEKIESFEILENKNGRTSRVMAEFYDDTGRLRSKFILSEYKRLKDVDKCWKYVPKWIVVTSLFAMSAILTIFIATLVITLTIPRPSFYKESCYRKSCINGLNLTCINNTCDCYDYQFYSNQCEDKRGYLEFCHYKYQCKDNKNLTCRDGVCKCNSTYYWNADKATCIVKKSNLQGCTTDVECRLDLMLVCDSGKCVCPSTRYWDGEVCMLKRTINETCKSSGDCITSQNLKCLKGICTCNFTIEYWEGTSYLQCRTKQMENNTCIGNIECYTPMNCTTGYCRCGPFQYHNFATLTCKNQTLNNTKCTISYNCRVDLGLECVNGICQCISSVPYWSTYHTMCIKPKTYEESTCSHITDCSTSQSLRCNLNSSYITPPCNCPSTSTVGMCDCLRVVSSEYYWNDSNCVPAKSNGQPCQDFSTSYMCQTLTQGTICNTSTGTYLCECPVYYYFNTLVCTPQLLYNDICLYPTACRSDLGLSCQLGLCLCNITYQFWSTTTTPNRCINYFNYTQSCSSTSLCNPYLSLICNSGSTCNCPFLSISGNCDCTRVANNETYWNGTHCVAAKAHGSICSGAGYNYMCQTLTQGTICNASSGIYKCECPPLKYFNGSYCLDEVIVNVGCPLGIECRADYGLICVGFVCICNATYQFWSTSNSPNRCIDYRNYTQTCQSSSECDAKLGLICYSTSVSACNCPSPSAVGVCDCVREKNNETYWSGSKCVPAGAYNTTCTQNYECQTKTQSTSCVSGRCLCGTDGGINSTSNMCAYCDSGWTYLYDLCYRVGVASPSNTDDAGYGPKVTAGCGRSSTFMAKIINSTVLWFFISKQSVSPAYDYWVDGTLNGTQYLSRDGTVSYPGSFQWCSGYPDGKNLVAWYSGSNCYRTYNNGGSIALRYFCQYFP